jgi:quercetin dioxygenase-like cupin family protein
MTMSPVMVARDDGERFHFLNTLHTAKITGEQTNGTLAAVEFLAPKNFGPPLHRHEAEDELFYILDGELWLSCGEVEAVQRQGAVVWLPRGLTHTFQVRSETAKVLCISLPSGFEKFVATLGEPTQDRTLPVPKNIHPAHVAEVCARFGIEVLGPPPDPVA